MKGTSSRDVFNAAAFHACRKSWGRLGGYRYFIHNPGELLKAMALKKNIGLVGMRIADIVEKIL